MASPLPVPRHNTLGPQNCSVTSTTLWHEKPRSPAGGRKPAPAAQGYYAVMPPFSSGTTCTCPACHCLTLGCDEKGPAGRQLRRLVVGPAPTTKEDKGALGIGLGPDFTLEKAQVEFGKYSQSFTTPDQTFSSTLPGTGHGSRVFCSV